MFELLRVDLLFAKPAAGSSRQDSKIRRILERTRKNGDNGRTIAIA
jgi:hypothetical protein